MAWGHFRTFTGDFLPTIMDVLDVKTDNPTWTMDGMSLLPYVMGNNSMPRPKPLGIQWVRCRHPYPANPCPPFLLP